MKNGRVSSYRIPQIFHPFLIFGIFGALSILIDIDHVLPLIQKELAVTPKNILTQSGQPLHLPVLLFCGALCIYSLARVYRFLPAKR